MERIQRSFEQGKLSELAPAVRKFVFGVIGGTILLLGLALIILPGPAFVVIPIGLAILASEFVWARRVIRRGRILIKKVKRNITGESE